MAKYSKQREIIYEYLKSHRTHPKAEKIFADLKQEYPSLSLATVYRNLKMFEEEMKVLVINSSDGTACYDADTNLHYHFECSKCGRIYDIPAPELSESISELAASVGRADAYSLIFYGVCNKCINK